MNTVTNATAWEAGYQAGISILEGALLQLAASPTEATLKRLSKTMKPAINPYKEA